jgi:ubiquinone/menaquinone biosynthesis C-methylase UbiE
MTSLGDAPIPGRNDLIWRCASVTSEYHASRTGIPFAEAHFAIMHRLFAAAGITVRDLLDLGAGDGIATAMVAERQPVERAVLVDFSEPMMDAARERFSLSGSGPAVSFVIGDFRESVWHEQVARAGPFDAVVSRFAIHHVPDEDKRALYGAVLEWLVPGGMFVNIEHVTSASDLYALAHDRMMLDGIIAAQESDADAESVAATYRARQDAGANILAPVEDQMRWLTAAGFVDVDCAFKAFELAVFAGRRPLS